MLEREFTAQFGENENEALFSAPGRSEIGGNHTDHQLGRVLAAAVTVDVCAVAAPRKDGIVNIHSLGFPPLSVSLDQLAPNAGEQNASEALVRGIAERFTQQGRNVGGFDAVTVSDVPKGSGCHPARRSASSCVPFFPNCSTKAISPPVEQALASKYAENKHFGKPSGLMDQLAARWAGLSPLILKSRSTRALKRSTAIWPNSATPSASSTAAENHADLTPEYASIPAEMGAVARFFGKTVLREVEESAFYAALPELRKTVSDRAILRAIHFFAENARVVEQANALKNGDAEAFRLLMNESGRSSFQYLQNVCPGDPSERGLALALALSERLLNGVGAWRVHGGGFAGTIQALVPLDRVEAYRAEIERVLGEGSCYRFAVRPVGGVMLRA
jgi:galactokinase